MRRRLCEKKAHLLKATTTVAGGRRRRRWREVAAARPPGADDDGGGRSTTTTVAGVCGRKLLPRATPTTRGRRWREVVSGDGDAAAGLLYRDGDAVRWWEAEASAGVTAAAARQRREDFVVSVGGG
jgi:hypothetical protein